MYLVGLDIQGVPRSVLFGPDISVSGEPKNRDQLFQTKQAYS